MKETDTVVLKREQPFIVVDQKVLKKCREKGSLLSGRNAEEASKSEILLTYFTIQEMAASGTWDHNKNLENYMISNLSGMPVDTIEQCLHVLEALGVFDEKD